MKLKGLAFANPFFICAIIILLRRFTLNIKVKDELIKDYINFISTCKTERECVKFAESKIKNEGFTDLHTHLISAGKASKCYINKMGKALGAFYINEPLEKGFSILCAHVDSPRLDIKQNPVMAEGQINFLNTHYYGGIRKYQWVTTPLAIHGVVCTPEGKTIEVVCGEDEDDPVFCISDLLPHLAQDQADKSARDFITGEELDVIIGSDASEKSEDVKKHIIDLIKEKYGFEEKDFESAELEVVPAGKARYLGFDKSMILGYGQDDRSCAYTSLESFLTVSKEKLNKNICLLLVDKEEIGSVGATGLDSNLFENMIATVAYHNDTTYNEYIVRQCLENSRMLSSDVNAAFDPHHSDVFDSDNTCYLGKGTTFCKFTGARGKSGSNDANPEYIATIKKALKDNNIHYQMSELGKVDKGGGGTIAYLAARYGMNVIDIGIPVLSMHAPWETTSVSDVYNAYEIYNAFLMNV